MDLVSGVHIQEAGRLLVWQLVCMVGNLHQVEDIQGKYN